MARTARTPVPRPPRHPVDEVPPARQLLAFGLQHVVAMYAGAIAVPLIVGQAVHLPPRDMALLINAGLLVSGIATLVQCVGVWRFGVRLPLMQGVTFAAASPMVAIATAGGGLPAVHGAVIVAGLAAVAVAPLFGRLLRFFPPVVTGTIILLIGVSLMPVAVRWAAGGAGSPGFGDPANIALAGGVTVAVLALQRISTGFLCRASVLLGIVAGTLAAVPLGRADFSGVADAGWFGAAAPLHFGAPAFEPAAIVAMVVVMLVAMTETTGDILAVAEITERPVDARHLTDGLRADAASTALAGVCNAFPQTAFAQNVGLVGLTGVKSRWVVACSGGILVVLGLFPVAGAVVAAIPAPVLGGAAIVMFGTVAAGGVRTLTQVDLADNANTVIVAASLGVGLVPVCVPTFYDRFPDWAVVVLHSGISAGSVTALVLNLVFHHLRRRPVVAAATGTPHPVGVPPRPAGSAP
ncbi:nucleobase:cation symporter-2 family protein [Actinomadura kijaniata]|uniref:nucleobase:cation symporter-2 family protein n=1 Tax=Actinomadura kijaniata TaxID=46161 RepID=UPI003F19B32C